MIKLSIIIPIYNGEKYIKKCVESLVNQKIKEIEIILINDGSKDNTDEICEELSIVYNSIKYFKIENSGCSFARNYGIKKSVGEYITFVDADDWVDKNMYFEMYDESKKKNLDILICGYEKINEKYKVIEKILPELKKENDYISLNSNWFNSPWNKIYKRSLIVDNNIEFLENCHMGEDMVFNVKVFKIAKKISILREAYYKYFVNQNSVSFDPDKRVEIFLAIKEIKKIGISSRKLDQCIRYHGITSTFATLEFLKERKKNWQLYYNQYLEEISYFQEYISIWSKYELVYRKLRLNFVFLKKYLKRG